MSLLFIETSPTKFVVVATYNLLLRETSLPTISFEFMETSPTTYNLLLRETSLPTISLLFMETSPTKFVVL